MAESAGANIMPVETAKLIDIASGATDSLTKAANAVAASAVGKTGITAISTASPVPILNLIHTITLAHPLAMLGFVGGSLVLLGLHDRVRLNREDKQPAQAAAGLASPENIW